MLVKKNVCFSLNCQNESYIRTTLIGRLGMKVIFSQLLEGFPNRLILV